jgi:hypothetical protein
MSYRAEQAQLMSMFDDPFTDFAEVGSKSTAEFYARVQSQEDILVGVNPLLLNAVKAQMLRDQGTKR